MSQPSLLSSPRFKRLLTAAILALTLGFFLWPFKQAIFDTVFKSYRPETENTADGLKNQEIILNEQIETEPDSFPMHIQSGYVEISNKQDISSYKFGPKGNPTKYLSAGGFAAFGVYVYQKPLYAKITDLSQLKSGDYIVITYYQSPAYSESSGGAGKTIMGIVDRVDKTGSNLSIVFLDDPQNTAYAFSKHMDYDTEDQLGLYKFQDALADNINRGSSLRISVDDQNKVKTVTVLAPRTNLVSGKVTSVGFSPAGETAVTLENLGPQFVLNNQTQIVKRGEPQTPKSISDITTGNFVNIVYYNRQNEYVVLSLDYQ